jgi:hypothetical protein
MLKGAQLITSSSHKINATSSFLHKMFALPFFHDYVSPYTWFHNDMTKHAKHLCNMDLGSNFHNLHYCNKYIIVAILILFHGFPLLIKLRLWTLSGRNISLSNVRSRWETLSGKNISHF